MSTHKILIRQMKRGLFLLFILLLPIGIASPLIQMECPTSVDLNENFQIIVKGYSDGTGSSSFTNINIEQDGSLLHSCSFDDCGRDTDDMCICSIESSISEEDEEIVFQADVNQAGEFVFDSCQVTQAHDHEAVFEEVNMPSQVISGHKFKIYVRVHDNDRINNLIFYNSSNDFRYSSNCGHQRECEFQSGQARLFTDVEKIMQYKIVSREKHDNLEFKTSFYQTIIVSPNSLPKFTTKCSPIGSVGEEYMCDISAVDGDGDDIIYSLKTAPDDMIINANNGIITWIPKKEGSFDIVVKADDDYCSNCPSQQFTINVLTEPPPENESVCGDEPPFADNTTICGTNQIECSSSNCLCTDGLYYCEDNNNVVCNNYCDGQGNCIECTQNCTLNIAF